jgi:hypothetical protein
MKFCTTGTALCLIVNTMSCRVGAVMTSVSQTEVTVTLNVNEVGTPAGRGMCGNAATAVEGEHPAQTVVRGIQVTERVNSCSVP